MKPADPDDERDDDLSAAFLTAPFPPTPQLAPVALRRLRRRRFFQRGSLVGMLLGAVVWIATWSRSNNSTDGVRVTVQGPLPDTRSLEMAELQVLFATPPVDALNQLEHQQAALLAAIGKVAQE